MPLVKWPHFFSTKVTVRPLAQKLVFSFAIRTLTSWPWLSMLVYRGRPTTPGYIGIVTRHHEDPYKTNQDSMECHKGFECCSYCAKASSTHQFGVWRHKKKASKIFSTFLGEHKWEHKRNFCDDFSTFFVSIQPCFFCFVTWELISWDPTRWLQNPHWIHP